MTTSYELSLRLKELGVEQSGGEYYWVEHWDGLIESLHKSQIHANTIKAILCRDFTLGEVVRMVDGVYLFACDAPYDGKWFAFVERDGSCIDSGHLLTPEEAAGELLCEILKQKGVSNG